MEDDVFVHTFAVETLNIQGMIKPLKDLSSIFILVFLGLLVSCSTSNSKNLSVSNSDTTSIGVNKAYKLINENVNNPNFVILDVRKPDDFLKEHIANAINIDFKSPNFSSKLDSLDKSKTYLIHCYGGFRSKNTMGMMQKKGFVRLYNMKGGIMKWKAKKLPVSTVK